MQLTEDLFFSECAIHMFSIICYRGKDESIPRYFPRAIKICVGGAGHLIHQDFPDIFMTELLKFIES